MARLSGYDPEIAAEVAQHGQLMRVNIIRHTRRTPRGLAIKWVCRDCGEMGYTTHPDVWAVARDGFLGLPLRVALQVGLGVPMAQPEA